MARALTSGRAWKTQSVLLRKAEFPTKAAAVRWLVRMKYRADRIEDSAIKPGGLPEGAGEFWRARQFDPTEGRPKATVVLGKGKRRGSVMLVREFGS